VKQQQPLDRDGSTLIVSDSKGLTYISEDTQKKKKTYISEEERFYG
jgi:hypothetical protein